MSTAKFDTLSTLDGSYSVPVSTVAQGTARAWVNFNGTGTVAIRAAFNVSSITDNGTGNYTLNFTTALPDANYSAVATTGLSTTAAGSTQYSAQPSGTGTTAFATTAYRLWSKQGAGLADVDLASVTIFR